MTKKRPSAKDLTEEEKRQAFTAASRKVFAALGINPDLSEAKIRFGSHSELSAEQEHQMAKAFGLQMSLQTAMNQLLPKIRTQEELDNAMRIFDEMAEIGPTVTRKLMAQIKTELPRRGGPGRTPLLNAEQSAKVCNKISEFMRNEKLTLKQAIAKTSEVCPKLVDKKVGVRTLDTIWGKRNEFPNI